MQIYFWVILILVSFIFGALVGAKMIEYDLKRDLKLFIKNLNKTIENRSEDKKCQK